MNCTRHELRHCDRERMRKRDTSPLTSGPDRPAGPTRKKLFRKSSIAICAQVSAKPPPCPRVSSLPTSPCCTTLGAPVDTGPASVKCIASPPAATATAWYAKQPCSLLFALGFTGRGGALRGTRFFTRMCRRMARSRVAGGRPKNRGMTCGRWIAAWLTCRRWKL